MAPRFLLIVAALPVLLAAQTQSPARYFQLGGEHFRVDPGGTFAIDPEVITVRFEQPISDLAGFQQTLTQSGEDFDPRLLQIATVRSNRLGYHDLRIPAGTDVFEMLDAVRATGLVQHAEENTFGRYGITPNDTDFNLQYALVNTGQTGGTADADIDADLAWDISVGDPSVVVAVIDSGTQISHPDLSSNIWTNTGEIPSNSIDDDSNGYVDDFQGWDFENNNNDPESGFFHGTFVAGVVAARTNNGSGVAGVAGGFTSGDGARVMALGAGEFFPVGAIIDDAIIYAADNGARIITLSFSVGSSQAIDDAINDAWNNDNVFINCAAGNNGFSVSYPASLDNVVSVASSNDLDNVSGFSNAGPENWVAAPGEDIRSLDLFGGYTTSSGTSFASPCVAGTAALMFSVAPGLTNLEVKTILMDTAEDIEAAGFDNDAGWGRINAFDAVEAAQQLGGLEFYCTGKLNSLGCVPFLSTTGLASNTSTNPFRIRANDLLAGQGGLMLYSLGKSNLNFHGGKLCVKSPIRRLLPAKIAKVAGLIPCPGFLFNNFNNRIQSGSDPLLTVGATVRAQYTARDPGDPAGFGDSLTNAVQFIITP